MDVVRAAVEDPANAAMLQLVPSAIAEQRRARLAELMLPAETTEALDLRLAEYRYIDAPEELRLGCSVRWFPLDARALEQERNLTLSGFVSAVREPDERGEHLVVCSNVMHRYYSFSFERCLVFQKLRPAEKLILRLVEHGRG